MLALKVDKPLFVVVHGTYRNELRFAKYHPIESREKLRYILRDIPVSQKRNGYPKDFEQPSRRLPSHSGVEEDRRRD